MGSRVVARYSSGTTLGTSDGEYVAARTDDAAVAAAAAAQLAVALDGRDAALTAAFTAAARRCSRRKIEADCTRRSTVAASSGKGGTLSSFPVADDGRCCRALLRDCCAVGKAKAGWESELTQAGFGLAGRT